MPPNTVNINPVQAAQFALMFLSRADMKAAEREPYAYAEGLLTAIASGQVQLMPAGQAPAPRPEAPTVGLDS
jgi:hypothetical protein